MNTIIFLGFTLTGLLSMDQDVKRDSKLTIGMNMRKKTYLQSKAPKCLGNPFRGAPGNNLIDS